MFSGRYEEQPDQDRRDNAPSGHSAGLANPLVECLRFGKGAVGAEEERSPQTESERRGAWTVSYLIAGILFVSALVSPLPSRKTYMNAKTAGKVASPYLVRRFLRQSQVSSQLEACIREQVTNRPISARQLIQETCPRRRSSRSRCRWGCPSCSTSRTWRNARSSACSCSPTRACS